MDPFDIIVKRVYKDFLNRDPDPDGYRNSINLLKQDKLTEEKLINIILNSDEYKQKKVDDFDTIVKRTYRSYLHREPDPDGYKCFYNSLKERKLTENQLVDVIKSSDEYKSLLKIDNEKKLLLQKNIIDSPQYQQKHKKYTVYGSCQADAVAQILNSNSAFKSQYEYVPVNRVQLLTENEINHLNKNILPTIDLFIYQPIHNYHPHILTKYIIDNVLKPDCVKIVFPFLYFTGYHPQDIVIQDVNVPNLDHDVNLLKLYLKGPVNISNFIETITQENYYDKEYLIKLIDKNIYNFEIREKTNNNEAFYIPVREYISNNYQKKLLFYTIAHPTKHLSQYIVTEILKYLGLPISFDTNIDTLSFFVMPIYNCVYINLNLAFERNDFYMVNNIPFTKQMHFQTDIASYDMYCLNVTNAKESLYKLIDKWESTHAV